MNKHLKRLIALTLLFALAASPSAARAATVAMKCGSGVCAAWMTAYPGTYSKCSTCKDDNYSYTCPQCGRSWAICPSRHYKELFPVG